MTVHEYTDIVAEFTDGLAAEVLAKFIASAGFSCGIVNTQNAMGLQCFGVRVVRSQIADVRSALRLTPIATRLSTAAAQIKAGQLAREDIPCYIGGEHSFGALRSSSLTLDTLTTLKETTEPGCMVAVPASLFQQAMHSLNQTPISDEELTKLALASDPTDRS